MQVAAGGEDMEAAEMHFYIQSMSLTGSSASPGTVSVWLPMPNFSLHGINRKKVCENMARYCQVSVPIQ